MNRDIYIFFKFLSFLPILRVTDDSNFGEIKMNSKKENLRFSLISFNIGKKIIHLVTFNNFEINRPMFRWLTIIQLNIVSKFEELIEKNGDKYDEYKVELDSKDSDKVESEKEYILHKISQTESSRNKTFNKFLAYIAIFALILPVYIPKITSMTSYFRSYKAVISVVLIYLFLNFVLFITEFIKVRKIKRTLFSSIRNSSIPTKELNASLYYEWLNIEAEGNYDVSLIKNMEKYMLALIAWSTLIMVILNSEGVINHIFDNPEINLKHQNNRDSKLVSFKSTENEGINTFLKKNNTEISKIQAGLIENEYSSVIIVSNKENELNSKLLNLIRLYNNQIKVIEIYNDDKLDQIEIILLKE